MSRTREQKTLMYEEHSAEFWSTHLGRYGGEMSAKANGFALAAAAVSALTGAAAWTTVADSKAPWAQILVTVMAVVAAVLAMWPSQAGYSDCAGQAATLSDEYAKALNLLRQAEDHRHTPGKHAGDVDKEVAQAEKAFLEARAGKDKLRPFPTKLQDELEALRAQLDISKYADYAVR
jgi:septal ring factor EnvC (AmiA/AmiB activator)